VAEPLSGIVLAGGGSRRLGTDKANLTFGDRTLLEIITGKLSPVCHEVIVASGSRPAQDVARLNLQFVKDSVPGAAPLAGLQAGLTAASAEFSLVIACDMPFLNRDLLEYMAGLPRRYQALVPLAADGWHPLHAVYARSSLPAIGALLAEGTYSMEKLLSRLHVQPLSEDEVRQHDADGLSLFNLNNSQDLARAQAIWKRRAGGARAR
jgi:molybdopterin-guanine dinucleotide biosynthesis protein A